MNNTSEQLKSLLKKCDGEFGCGYDGTQEDRQALCGGPVPSLHPTIKEFNDYIRKAINVLENPLKTRYIGDCCVASWCRHIGTKHEIHE